MENNLIGLCFWQGQGANTLVSDIHVLNGENFCSVFLNWRNSENASSSQPFVSENCSFSVVSTKSGHCSASSRDLSA